MISKIKLLFSFSQIPFMKKIAIRTLLAACFVFFIACKKSSNNNNSNSSVLSGNWAFMGFNAKTTTTDQYTSGSVYKSITNAEYVTAANGGSISFSGNAITASGITYSSVDTMFETDYKDNVIVDTFTSTYPFTIPSTNSSTTFELIGTDSIHFTSANMIGFVAFRTPDPSGGIFSISGSIMTLTTNTVEDKVIDSAGFTINQHETATVIATLQKQ
jgi:hypothetical protein